MVFKQNGKVDYSSLKHRSGKNGSGRPSFDPVAFAKKFDLGILDLQTEENEGTKDKQRKTPRIPFEVFEGIEADDFESCGMSTLSGVVIDQAFQSTNAVRGAKKNRRGSRRFFRF